MRRVLQSFLFGLLLASGGCGGTGDAQPNTDVSPEERQKKADEAKAANEKGMQEAPRGRPGG
jgi:hypothetical protein